MTRYQRGDQWEKRTARLLSDDGYLTVQTRGSRGPADVYAIKPSARLAGQVQNVQVLAVQVKRSSRAGAPLSALIGHEAWNLLYAMEPEYGVVPLLADWCGQRAQLRLRRLTGAHVPHQPHWPCEPFALDEVAGD